MSNSPSSGCRHLLPASGEKGLAATFRCLSPHGGKGHAGPLVPSPRERGEG
ncbi:hypothetical protein SAMCFNEI73_Ch1008 [Sinorhizobium americanum]|uniref:Uncharacterized protein n=1 Tax=Sinorhizobium americanum TaxID=194963 RepID=A0A1L3LJV2_9HYPH|nr:hypothetical protein SAMCFNEI73_Ch1008 [Sinorhizobium americanum]